MRKSFVSLFAGAGGLDLGLSRAGWTCHYASDIDANAVQTLRQNLSAIEPGCIIEQRDVRTLDGDEILDRCNLKQGTLGLLAGGPPCQSWSSAGHQRGKDDPRGQLFFDYIRLAKELQPEFLLIENVRGLVTARGSDGEPGSALEEIRCELFKVGYRTTVSLLNAADYGLPQRRVRLFLIGFRGNLKPEFPVATHEDQRKQTCIDKKPWVSMGECLQSILPPTPEEIIRPSGKMKTELIGVKPGSGVKSPGKKETTRPGGHWGYKQGAFVADVCLPARTVTASGQQDWIIDSQLGLRRLTPRECAALQGFPSDWTFAGTRAQQYKQIGNAVPPLIGALMGHAIAAPTKNAPVGGSDFKTNANVALPERLLKAVDYTRREERRNGASRRAAPARRRAAVVAADGN